MSFLPGIDSVFTIMLDSHIAAGTVALIAGAGAGLTRKGGQRHRQFGKVYVVATAGVVLTTFVLAGVTQNAFLFTVGVFTGYMTFAGYRVLAHKRPLDEPRLVDWSASMVMVITGIVMIAVGTRQVIIGPIGLGPGLIAFGALGIGFAGQDLYSFVRPPADRFDWFYRHISRMGGSYIATVTAVSAVNFWMLPPLVRWLWPSVVGTLLLVITTSRYKRRFTRGEHPRDVAVVGQK